MMRTQFPTGRTAIVGAVACSCAWSIGRSWWRGSGPALDLSFLSLFACFSYASIACYFLLTAAPGGARRIAAAAMAACGIAGALLAAAAWSRNADPLRIGKWTLVALGAVGVLAHAGSAMHAGTAMARRREFARLRDALILPLAAIQVPFFLSTNAQINPVYDPMVFAFERLLAVPFSAFATQSYAALASVGLIATACYLAISVGLAAVAALQPNDERTTRVFLAAITAGACGFLLYSICPAVGPLHAFGAPPALSTPLTHPSPMNVVAEVPRNGMPSLHTVWALLIIANAFVLPRWWRLSLTTFALINIWTAIARYQHWFIDLVVAVPLAAAFHFALVRTDRRVRALGCAFLAIGWLVALRQGVLLDAPVWLAWVMVVLTAGWPFFTSRERTASAPQ